MIENRYSRSSLRKTKVKNQKYYLKVNNGKLNSQYTLPLGYILRNLLKIGETLKETKKELKSKKVLVNNKLVNDLRYPISFLETFTLISKEQEKRYRIVFEGTKKAYLMETDEQKKWLPVVSKRRSSEKIQINTLGGFSFLFPIRNEITFNQGDSIEIDEKTGVRRLIKLKEESKVKVIRGKFLGRTLIFKKKDKNNYYLLEPYSNKIVNYSSLYFFPITGEAIPL
jgi:small subunit ribosomal protein S4e